MGRSTWPGNLRLRVLTRRLQGRTKWPQTRYHSPEIGYFFFQIALNSKFWMLGVKFNVKLKNTALNTARNIKFQHFFKPCSEVIYYVGFRKTISFLLKFCTDLKDLWRYQKNLKNAIFRPTEYIVFFDEINYFFFFWNLDFFSNYCDNWQRIESIKNLEEFNERLRT